MTKLQYLEYPDLFESTARIVQSGVDTRGRYLVLDQSLFYPQGGGQPADQGVITTVHTTYNVDDVRTVDGQIRHYTTDDTRFLHPISQVNITVNQERRLLNSKYHTAGHLIAAVVEQENGGLKAVKGHQFPGEAYVEFIGSISDIDNFLAQIKSKVSACIKSKRVVTTEVLRQDHTHQLAQDLAYELPQIKSLRVCHITGFSPVPCGGTHIKTLNEISLLALNKCKSKKGKTKIHYEVG